jgi:hypothetical protein
MLPCGTPSEEQKWQVFFVNWQSVSCGNTVQTYICNCMFTIQLFVVHIVLKKFSVQSVSCGNTVQAYVYLPSNYSLYTLYYKFISVQSVSCGNTVQTYICLPSNYSSMDIPIIDKVLLRYFHHISKIGLRFLIKIQSVAELDPQRDAAPDLAPAS